MPAQDFESNIGHLIHQVDLLMSREFDLRMKPLGLTRAQWQVLARLYFSNGITQSELSDELGCSRMALVGLLDRLEAKGEIERRAHPTDRRAKCVFALPKVEGLLVEMEQIARTMTADATSVLSPTQRDELAKLLRLLRDDLVERDRKLIDAPRN
jgi:MarR family transcriptional regulator, transcriptional regulator for hemolysin